MVRFISKWCKKIQLLQLKTSAVDESKYKETKRIKIEKESLIPSNHFD